jgi:hypothetical protein
MLHFMPFGTCAIIAPLLLGSDEETALKNAMLFLVTF